MKHWDDLKLVERITLIARTDYSKRCEGVLPVGNACIEYPLFTLLLANASEHYLPPVLRDELPDAVINRELYPVVEEDQTHD